MMIRYPIADIENENEDSFVLTDERRQLIEMVAESDEFYEFSECAERLYQKFAQYKNNLSKEKQMEYEANSHDAQYFLNFIKEAGLEKERAELNMSRQKFLERIAEVKLKDWEVPYIFFGRTTEGTCSSIAPIKTRSEGKTYKDCTDAWHKAIRAADDIYNYKIATCDNSPNPNCEREAFNEREKVHKEADKKYKECLDEVFKNKSEEKTNENEFT